MLVRKKASYVSYLVNVHVPKKIEEWSEATGSYSIRSARSWLSSKICVPENFGKTIFATQKEFCCSSALREPISWQNLGNGKEQMFFWVKTTAFYRCFRRRAPKKHAWATSFQYIVTKDWLLIYKIFQCTFSTYKLPSQHFITSHRYDVRIFQLKRILYRNTNDMANGLEGKGEYSFYDIKCVFNFIDTLGYLDFRCNTCGVAIATSFGKQCSSNSDKSKSEPMTDRPSHKKTVCIPSGTESKEFLFNSQLF